MTIYTAAGNEDMPNLPARMNADDDAFWRAQTLLEPGDDMARPDRYPRLFNMSAGLYYPAVLRATDPAPPEYVTLPQTSLMSNREARALDIAVAQWNMQWEAAQYRRRIFDEEDLPSPLRELADRGDFNIVFVPRTESRYHEYASLFHLLPRSTVQRYGLPLLHAGQWPFLISSHDSDPYLPADFEKRLAAAWASTVWGHTFYKSPMSGFSDSDPIKLLAHNLDYWLPAVTEVIQQELRSFPEADKGVIPRVPRLTDGSLFEGGVRCNPRIGGDVWAGEAEAALMLERTIEAADTTGRFRDILDAVRSNRVEEDFSERWTYAREDFERKLHHKRLKIKVRFVELTDSVPIQGPETEIIGQMVCSDFLAVLDPRDRQVVVLLSSGVTRVGEVASIMGYRNHSAVSKRLKRIGQQALQFFENY